MENLVIKLENNIQHLTDEQYDWIRLQLVNHKLGNVETYNMNITLINRDLFLIVRDIKHRRDRGWYQKIHSFMMMEEAGGLYELVKQ